MKKIKVYARHSYYSSNSTLNDRIRPEWFDKSKIWENFIKVTDFNICDIKVIYDTYYGDNSNEFFNNDIEIVKINSGTEANSFLELLKIIESDNLSDDTIIYIMEDDYLHRENWYNILVEGIEISDYVTLYDHLDKYLYYDNLLSNIYLTKSSHWRTTPSTCNTYACKMKTLKDDMHIHRKFSIENNNGISQDHQKFLNLNKIGKKLISCIPAYSTHCDLMQSPTINWKIYT
jgi:hypothetical protein